MKAVILNTDNSVVCQELNRDFATDRIELIDLRARLQFYADANARSAFAARVAPNGESPTVHLLGSGNFHHLTLMMLERLAGPFLLVVFDNHLDCSSLGPKYHCGNWLYHAALLPGCSMVLHCGAGDGQGWLRRFDGTARLIRRGKLRQVPGSKVTAPDFEERVLQLLSSCNARQLPLYISVDKDVLRQEEAPGDWDNGVMSFMQLISVLKRMIRMYPLAGADIAGEKGGPFYYPYRPLKNILSWIEHRDNGDTTPLAVAVEKQRGLNVLLLDAFGVRRVDEVASAVSDRGVARNNRAAVL